MTRRSTLVLVGLLVALVATTQWLRVRPDQAAEPGLRMAVLLLLQADARVTAMRSPDLGVRAERAALVRATWDADARAARLARAEQQDAGATATQRQAAALPELFVATRWETVDASAHRGHVRVVGHYRSWQGTAWRDAPDRTWDLRLTRDDPVGRTRGWHLLSVA